MKYICRNEIRSTPLATSFKRHIGLAMQIRPFSSSTWHSSKTTTMTTLALAFAALCVSFASSLEVVTNQFHVRVRRSANLNAAGARAYADAIARENGFHNLGPVRMPFLFALLSNRIIYSSAFLADRRKLICPLEEKGEKIAYETQFTFSQMDQTCLSRVCKSLCIFARMSRRCSGATTNFIS